MDKILILTGYEPGFEPLAQLSIPLLQQYATGFGHHLHVVTKMTCAQGPIWAKILSIRTMLAAGHPLIFWIDADALIVRRDTDLRGQLPADQDVAMSWHGPQTARVDDPNFPPHFNAGVMLIRNTPWSRDFFDRVWALRDDNIPPWHDQSAILWLLGYRNCLGLGEDVAPPSDRAKVGHLDCVWNSIPGAASVDDPIVHHYAGLANEARLDLMAADARSVALRIDSSDLRREISLQLNQWAASVRSAAAYRAAYERTHNEVAALKDQLAREHQSLLHQKPKSWLLRTLAFGSVRK